MKYLGMQILVEGLALGTFDIFNGIAEEPLFKEITRYVMKDESRHVAFGVLSLEGVYDAMSREEVRKREEFAYDVCLNSMDDSQALRSPATTSFLKMSGLRLCMTL